MKPLAVLHVNTEATWRGGEAQTLMLAQGLASRGHTNILALRRGGALQQAAKRGQLEVVPLPMRGEFDPASIFGLAEILRERTVDLLHYHTSHAVTLGTLATLISGRRPAVVTRRVSFSLGRNPLARLKYNFRISHLIAVSDGVRWVMVAEGISPARVSVIHSGIDLGRFDRPRDRGRIEREFGIPESAFLLGSVGHLAQHKGHTALIEAAAIACESVPDLRVLIVGEGGERPTLEAAARSGPLAGRVVFTGFREDVPDLMASLDALVLTSFSGEGSPAVVKEAMACGVPVVASDLDGVREIVEDGRDGVLVPVGDPVALASAIDSLVGDPARREALARAGRARVREFSSDRMVERTLEIYRQVTGSPGGSG
jgi:glycosyltransferase involved in cell wall biosynthesis